MKSNARTVTAFPPYPCLSLAFYYEIHVVPGFTYSSLCVSSPMCSSHFNDFSLFEQDSLKIKYSIIIINSEMIVCLSTAIVAVLSSSSQ